MPERGERQPYHHGDLRNALARHALRTIETEGLAALSLRESARALGVSPSAVYRHFADKATLVAAVAESGFERLAHAMETAAKAAEERAPSGEAEHAALLAMGAAYVRFAGAHPSHFGAMLEGGPGKTKPPRELVGRAADRLLAEMPPAEKRAARRAAFAALHGLAMLVAHGTSAEREPTACETAAREVLELVLRGARAGSLAQRDAGIGVSAKDRSSAAPSGPASTTPRRDIAGSRRSSGPASRTRP